MTLTVWDAFGDGTVASGADGLESVVFVVGIGFDLGDGADGLTAVAATADSVLLGGCCGVAEACRFGLATVNTDGSGFVVFVFFGIVGLFSMPILVKGGTC